MLTTHKWRKAFSLHQKEHPTQGCPFLRLGTSVRSAHTQSWKGYVLGHLLGLSLKPKDVELSLAWVQSS